MDNVSEIKGLLQKSVEILYKSQRFCEAMYPIAQKMGVQALKRRLRYHAQQDFITINHIRSYAFDRLGISLENNTHPVQIHESNSYQALFTTVLEKEEHEHTELHSIANKLVVGNAKCFAEWLYCHCCLIDKDIVDIRREMLEYSSVDYSPEFILLKETTAGNYHDDLEKKEESVGYKD